MIPPKVRALYKQYENFIPVGFFALGFIFDALMLQRIDDLITVVQQAVYLVAAGGMIGYELTYPGKKPKWLDHLLHFMLGTLFNSFAIFYFKSASSWTSYFFVFLLFGILVFNEFAHEQRSRIRTLLVLWSLSVISLMVCFVPMAVGRIGDLPFLGAVVLSGGALYGYAKLLRADLRPQLVKPFVGTQVAFFVLYFLHVIPPIPLSIKYMGIYHDVLKSANGGEYELVQTRPWWKFWQHGDQSFEAKPGDVIHCYAQVFSPARFKDQLQVRWLFKDPRVGWMPQDAIPLNIVGGREEGFRSITKKSNYTPGQWRVQIETLGSREIGRIDFEVFAAAEAAL